MDARTQYELNAIDLETVLSLVRAGTLAGAGERLGVDPSTIFRSVQRIERGLGQRLFERSRSGYLPSEQAQVLAGHAEQMEAQLESARSAAQLRPEQVSGTVRLTTTQNGPGLCAHMDGGQRSVFPSAGGLVAGTYTVCARGDQSSTARTANVASYVLTVAATP